MPGGPLAVLGWGPVKSLWLGAGCKNCVKWVMPRQGWFQDFHGGGGGAKKCARTHITSANPEVPITTGPGVQGPLQGPGSSRGFDALSCYLRLIFLNILIQNGIKNTHNRLKSPSGSATVKGIFQYTYKWFRIWNHFHGSRLCSKYNTCFRN